MKNRAAGFTLIETVLVLLIAALIIGGIWIGYSQVRLNQQVNDTIAVLDQTLQVTRDYLATQSSVPPTLSTDLYNAGVMPATLSYKGPTSIMPSADPYIQTFISPLGYEFSVDYVPPNLAGNFGNAYLPKVFEVFIWLQNQSIYVAPMSGQQLCLQIMPKLIGNLRMIHDRGLLGYWYGGKWYGILGTPITTWNSPNSTTVADCSGSYLIQLVFSMRP